MGSSASAVAFSLSLMHEVLITISHLNRVTSCFRSLIITATTTGMFCYVLSLLQQNHQQAYTKIAASTSSVAGSIVQLYLSAYSLAGHVD
eukprot:scaffold247138_cov17-Prasinocladus_malaysianus.AAC.1